MTHVSGDDGIAHVTLREDIALCRLHDPKQLWHLCRALFFHRQHRLHVENPHDTATSGNIHNSHRDRVHSLAIDVLAVHPFMVLCECMRLIWELTRGVESMMDMPVHLPKVHF